jgi:hypothetical protein
MLHSALAVNAWESGLPTLTRSNTAGRPLLHYFSQIFFLLPAASDLFVTSLCFTNRSFKSAVSVVNFTCFC